jgi:hypothetical protein
MAKSGDNDGGSTGSWPGFLSELTKSFLILRDIFGYALPGSVFLGIGVLCRRFSLHDVEYFLQPYKIPAWLAVVLGLGACYTTGHLMAQLAYFPFNRWGWPFGKAKGQLDRGQTAVSPPLIMLRESHPALLTELDRALTMTQLRGSTGAAMLMGFVLFYAIPTPPLGTLAGVAGVFLLLVFWLSGMPHLSDLTRDTITAAIEADKTPAPGDPQAGRH